MTGYLAYIIPLGDQGGGPVDPGFGKPLPPSQIWGGVGQPGPWPGPPAGGPPLVPGWPSIPPYPGQNPPGQQPPVIWPGPGRPEHPWVPPGPGSGPPLVPGWPSIPPHPGQSPPGQLPGYIWGPTDPRPTPPIYLPPGATLPPPGDGAHPEHPIYYPETPPPDPGKAHVVVGAFIPGSGQGIVYFLVEAPPPPTAPGPKA